ncbi:MAG TPA: RluA family pseudouridine synthase [Planctomycetaceae bacterium]|nr:RluA family pseudouridine synthase [Planctomycetaceae bacterium]
MSEIVKQLTVPEGPAQRIDRCVQELTGLSRGAARGLFDHGCVRLNGDVCDEPGKVVAPGETVEVRYDPQRRYRERRAESVDRAYRLVFEDADVIVVDKAADVLTVPTDRGEPNTLVSALERHVRRRNPRGKLTVVQRLDRGTSGLLVFGKTPRAGTALRTQFAGRKPDREYLALVAGSLAEPAGTFRTRMATNRGLQRYSTSEKGNGELAITHYSTEGAARGATLIRARLETGRRNQIRVHFAEVGHPVLGDERYRPDLAAHAQWPYKRLALHAAILGFAHPRTGEVLRFESPLPVEFAKFLGR